MPNSWICVDANLVVRYVIGDPDQTIDALWQRWELEDKQLVAPKLSHYEITNALYRYQQQRLLTADTVQIALNAALVVCQV